VTSSATTTFWGFQIDLGQCSDCGCTVVGARWPHLEHPRGHCDPDDAQGSPAPSGNHRLFWSTGQPPPIGWRNCAWPGNFRIHRQSWRQTAVQTRIGQPTCRAGEEGALGRRRDSRWTVEACPRCRAAGVGVCTPGAGASPSPRPHAAAASDSPDSPTWVGSFAGCRRPVVAAAACVRCGLTDRRVVAGSCQSSVGWDVSCSLACWCHPDAMTCSPTYHNVLAVLLLLLLQL